ncbi:amidase family protein [Christiangramia forsetii]|uniref:Glutamyl-tRNA(Gln) amidotransferase subunit A n=2 Tax=Christiangramia forsetii TaxID=411153 RepID=A0M3L0_CHRFK|nr:amidase family protein [Christiangramia forsetii]GGG25601.1 amidase [Christiangramia forsetii]CAL67205.1 glutamyl-tRNA(Gln) amidotransferase subunit A [Christiangramia forsetii KT0803]
MKKLVLLFIAVAMFSCKNDTTENTSETKQDQPDSTKVEEMEFKQVDSKIIDNDSLWKPFDADLSEFSSEVYEEVKALAFEKSIPEIQEAIESGKLTYEELVLFYLTRIMEYDRENEFSLNSVISLNPNIIEEARAKDQQKSKASNRHPIYGIPVLLKDNINTTGTPTTAGSVALQNNQTEDAFIVKQLKNNGALILGKANLSEWANFFCEGCPNGFSTIGGQTLNPYGRKVHDTGGSSSGSGVAVAANFAPVAVGSETSGSILSPASSNSVVGLKPTIGVLSRGGIVPISSTLDTPGPITKFVIDNAILLDAMKGVDNEDVSSKGAGKQNSVYYSNIKKADLKDKRFGVIKALMDDSLYVRAINDLKKAGAEIVEFEAEDIDLPNFRRLLNLDMKKDLPAYLKNYGGDVSYKNVQDVVDYNTQDSLNRAPYGQALFMGILKDSASEKDFSAIKDTLKTNGTRFFEKPMKELDLDAVLSINNYHAGYAAVAKYPAITVPMGYSSENQPRGLTFIGKPFTEEQLLQFAYIFEKNSQRRKTPGNYNE